MTEKQFKAIGKDIWQGNEIWCVAGGEHCADVIATALNEQHETIQLLKKEIERLKGRYYYENNKDNPRINVEDIIGLIHTDEPTNSVELKKELYK